MVLLSICACPGFGWDRVNFQKTLGGLTQTSQMGYSIPYDVMLSIEVGELAGRANFLFVKKLSKMCLTSHVSTFSLNVLPAVGQ